MPDDGQLNGVATGSFFMRSYFANYLSREVSSLKKAKDIPLLEVGIPSQGDQDLLGRLLEKWLDLGSSRRCRALGTLGQLFAET